MILVHNDSCTPPSYTSPFTLQLTLPPVPAHYRPPHPETAHALPVCATTCIAAERLKRQWVGIDIWDKAEEVVLERMEHEGLVEASGLFNQDKPRQGLLFYEDLHFTPELPVRTDGGGFAAPPLKTIKKVQVIEPGPRMSRKKMYQILLTENGAMCAGCDRVFDDPRYLELDHNTPRSSAGINHISNRVLLCGPCNKLKSNLYTLVWLRRENKKRGYMAAQ